MVYMYMNYDCNFVHIAKWYECVWRMWWLFHAGSHDKSFSFIINKNMKDFKTCWMPIFLFCPCSSNFFPYIYDVCTILESVITRTITWWNSVEEDTLIYICKNGLYRIKGSDMVHMF